MKRNLSLVLVLLLASSARAGFMAANANFPDSTAPNDIRFELRTAADDFVRWDWTYQTRNSIGPWSTSIGVFENESTMPPWFQIDSRHSTAAIQGIDWQAWQAAILNPAFNRWVVTRNGVTIEQPWTREVLSDGGFAELDELRIALGKKTNGVPGDLRVVAASFDNPDAPEPATLVMLALGVACLGRGRRG